MGLAFCLEKTFGIEQIDCWMHKMNNFIDTFNKNISKNYDLFKIWLKFVHKSSAKIPKTNFKFVMEPTILASNTNRMALTYLSQAAVYHNLESVKQWWGTNDPGNKAYLDFQHHHPKVMFIATLSLLISDVC